mmetsp:Transcript_90769/g.241182  ORF Transcript_90769/g.241182 Transcript_90769/m.241182 type:complete len:234 (-) Transcript_90769:51-752(-)
MAMDGGPDEEVMAKDRGPDEESPAATEDRGRDEEGPAVTEDSSKAAGADVLSVCVSNIDKMTSDEELIAHFSGPAEGPSGVRGVEQFANPKHTARVDLEGEESLQRALALDGSMVGRRTVKVEPWDDRIFDSMTALERKFASASKPVGRPKLLMKPRSKPMPEAEEARPWQPADAGARSDPFAGAPLQRPRREDATRADVDADWRSRPAEAPPEKPWGLWSLLDRCCRRRPPD